MSDINVHKANEFLNLQIFRILTYSSSLGYRALVVRIDLWKRGQCGTDEQLQFSSTISFAHFPN